MRKKRKSQKVLETPKVGSSQECVSMTKCFEGACLTGLLQKLQREIELGKHLKGDLPEKIWIKKQFSIGVNEVTRVLERMPCIEVGNTAHGPFSICSGGKASSVQLQAVLLASDCNPRWLTKHLPSLASSRGVPLIFIKDKKGGSLRLGELVNLKTAISIGVKAKESGINKAIEEVLLDNGSVVGTGLPEISSI
eukprot:TRINITY_DN3984_c0_g1_i1.p1 TRINITY_DN3984_c0_g1~~TRINITY_DN3984_c0_g1_i1.p1  ORF type:complete len:194 (+),score=30.30 TRINITY_DN3984_c0_g1_i1:276-857(+)